MLDDTTNAIESIPSYLNMNHTINDNNMGHNIPEDPRPIQVLTLGSSPPYDLD